MPRSRPKDDEVYFGEGSISTEDILRPLQLACDVSVAIEKSVLAVFAIIECELHQNSFIMVEIVKDIPEVRQMLKRSEFILAAYNTPLQDTAGYMVMRIKARREPNREQLGQMALIVLDTLKENYKNI